MNGFSHNRRQFLAAGSAGLALALGPRLAGAQGFPSENMRVVIATGEGGGIDQAARAFTTIWSKHLGSRFEFSYYPGASGQVGYELFLNKSPADCYNLLFGNIGPEMIMYALQQPDYSYPDDYLYFGGIDTDDSVIWVAADSKFKSLEEMIDAGQSRPITLSTSRLPHPSTLGVLALSEATGMQVRMIPYGGGGPARSAALTGEVDGSATFLTSSLSLGDQIRFLTVFNSKNRAPEATNDAPLASDVAGTPIPDMTGVRAWAIQRSAMESYPDRYEVLSRTLREALADPAYVEVAAKTGTPSQFIEYSDPEACDRNARETLELAKKYQDQLSGRR